VLEQGQQILVEVDGLGEPGIGAVAGEGPLITAQTTTESGVPGGVQDGVAGCRTDEHPDEEKRAKPRNAAWLRESLRTGATTCF
jgi:hypothetical protein